MTDFGKLLRLHREQRRDPNKGRGLSQQRLGELLGEELGTTGYSGAAVSDWENNKSKVHKDDRLLLITIFRVLYKNGGLKTLLEAESLMEAGNYRALNEREKQQIFPKDLLEQSVHSPTTQIKEQKSFTYPFGDAFIKLTDEIQGLWDEAKAGPPPVWPRFFTAVLRKLSDQISVVNTFHALLWLWIWIASYIMVNPVLDWSSFGREIVFISILKYVCASILIPPCIGVLTNTKDNPFWQKNATDASRMLRLYTYQGAFIGFHLGYFMVFAIHLLMYFLQARPAMWSQFLLMGFPLLMGYISARVVPYNLWRAYGRLWFSDGAVFFVFILLGPLWGWFFFEFYAILISPTTGIIVILAAISLLLSLMTLQYQRKGNTAIPVRWWIILYGLILVCQIILIFIK